METNFKNTWMTYTDSWKCKSNDEKIEKFTMSLSQDCRYTDPLIKTCGWDELIGYMNDFHKQIPGGHFETINFMSHNSLSVAQWNMISGDGNIVGTGISYGEYDNNGKLKSMIGFYEVPKN